MSEPALPPAAPAATLILLRGRQEGPPALLMLERAAGMAFGPGALVFPGGRVDPGDHALAAGLPLDPDDAAARVAAIRETIEEAGIAVGLDPAPGPDKLAAIRTGLAEGRDFGGLLKLAGCRLDLDALTPFTRWRPPVMRTRMFDTRFYLARVPPATEAAVDGAESVASIWADAATLIAGHGAGRHQLLVPTLVTLHRLAQHIDVAAIFADAAAWPPDLVTVRRERRDGQWHAVIAAQLGYPALAVPLEPSSAP